MCPCSAAVFLENVVPAVGGVIAVVLFLSPMKAVLRARREKAIGVSLPACLPAVPRARLDGKGTGRLIPSRTHCYCAQSYESRAGLLVQHALPTVHRSCCL